MDNTPDDVALCGVKELRHDSVGAGFVALSVKIFDILHECTGGFFFPPTVILNANMHLSRTGSATSYLQS